MNYKEAMELPSDVGCFPRFFSWISLPLRTTSKGFSSEKDRYVHKSNEITLELSTNEKTAKLPLGQVGRTVIAYLATKIVRPQFVQMRKDLGYSSAHNDVKIMKNRFPSFKFYLPSLSVMTKDIMGSNGGKNMKTVYEQLRGFLLCSVYIAPSKQVQKIFPYIPERLFIFANEVKINNGIKKQNTENYVILTREGVNFLLDTVPLVFNDYRQLSSPLEQDLYVYLTRKSYIYNKFDKNYSVKESDKIKDYPNATFPETPKKIKLEHLVLQFFNIKRDNKNYKRAEEKLKEAYSNLTYKYEKLGDSVFLLEDTFYILGNNDLFNFSEVIIKVKEKKEKAIFLRALEKRRNQKPFIKKYLKDNQNRLPFIYVENKYDVPHEVAI